jgi:Ca2+-dependent lipid-binding protein
VIAWKLKKSNHKQVLEAWGLVDLDAWGTIDPFCTVRVESKGLPPQERRTAHENDTDCPEWNHYFEFLANDDPDGTIQLTVFDQDFTKVDLLGSVTVKFSEIMAQVGRLDR